MKKIIELETENEQMRKVSNELEEKFKKMEELMFSLDSQKLNGIL